jgi:hypothetical protein
MMFARGIVVAAEPRRRALIIQTGTHKGWPTTTTVTIDRRAWADVRENLDTLLGGSATVSGGRLLTQRGVWPLDMGGAL